MKLSKYFDRSEFACGCGCGFDTVDSELLRVLDEIRAGFDRPVRIHSACRCPNHNRAVGGSTGSQHLIGRAADISVGNTHPGTVADMAEELLPEGGVGRYNTFTHVDSRGTRARWDFR